MLVGGVKDGVAQPRAGVANQGADEDPLGRPCPGAVTFARTAISAGVADILPVGGSIDGTAEIARIDEGLQQPQRVAEARAPILCQAPFTQREDARGEIPMVVSGQDQKTTIIGDQVQPVVLMTEIPTDPVVTGCTLPGGGAKVQQGQPLAAPSGHIPQGVADLGQ